MDRFFSAASSQDPNFDSNKKGKFLIATGWTLLGLVALDQALQYRQEQEAKEHRRMLEQMQQEANAENQLVGDPKLPKLFSCKIIHTEPSLDGVKMLQNIRVGDVVDVLETGVGPNQAYHLCRQQQQSNSNTDDKLGVVGWYPIQYLEKVDQEQ